MNLKINRIMDQIVSSCWTKLYKEKRVYKLRLEGKASEVLLATTVASASVHQWRVSTRQHLGYTM